jgi:conjugal transfer pilus assembly protein TraW
MLSFFMSNVIAKDFNIVGETFPILEQDLLAVIMQKLTKMQESGELMVHQKILQNKVKEKILKPAGITLKETTKAREFYFDPSLTVTEDLVDLNGKVFQHQGAKINPLDFYSFKETWIFFDGASKKQAKFAIQFVTRENTKLILTNGNPLALMKKLKVPIYFDQFGYLVQKLGISKVPAMVFQEGKQLKIKEIELPK